MSCTCPNFAIDLGIVDGKRKIKFLPKRIDSYSLHTLEEKYGKEYILQLPCGHCTSCLLNYARTWAVRCCLEASLYKNNYFVTLTYDDQNLPSNSNQARRDVQLFFKRLRKEFPGVRYFGCLERGENTHRFHHHIILFNLDLYDVVPLGKRALEGYYYKSRKLSEIWSNGFIDIGDVSFNSCGYIARYCMKKRFKESKDEFIYMSTKPGIGLGWLEKHLDTCIKYDEIYFNFGNFSKAKLPRYFDKHLEKVNPEAVEQLKRQRISSANLSSFADLIRYGLVYREELYSQKAEKVESKVKRLKRGL